MLIDSTVEEELNPLDSAVGQTTFPEQKTWLGLRTSALLEITIFLGIAWGIDFQFGSGNGFATVDPNPYWIIILVITVQYGRWEGLVVSVLASGIYIFANYGNSHVFGRDIYENMLANLKLPMLWFVTSTVVGELRLRHIRERDKLRQHLIEAQGRELAITKAYVKMHKVKDRMETQVAGQTQTMISYFKMAQIMEAHDTETILKGARDLVKMVLNPESFSIFLLKQHGLEAVIKEGWSNQGYIELFEPYTPLFRSVIGSQDTLVIARTQDRAILEDQGIIASPLVSAESGNFIGMLKVERLEFSELNTSNIESFKLLCEWIGIAYDKARRHHRAQTEKMVNEDHNLFSKGFLQRQIEVFTVLARRNKFDLCLIIIRLSNPKDLSDQEARRLPASMGEIMSRAMRTTDMVFDYEVTGEEFAILLPSTEVKYLPQVEEKVRGILGKKLTWVAPLAVFSVSSKVIFQAQKKGA